MSTRSRIGIVNKDGKVVSIYCHSDGYPSYNGNILRKHYKSERKVRELIGLGDISVLDRKISPDPKGGRVRDYDHFPRTKPANGRHSFDYDVGRQIGVTLAYHRDRGDCWRHCQQRVDPNAEAFVGGDVEEWGYLFKDGKWFYVDGHKSRRKLVELTEAECKKELEY